MRKSFTLLFLWLAGNCFGQISKPQADQLVLTQILPALGIDTAWVDIYSLPAVQSATAVIPLECEPLLELPYAQNWVYFTDEHPMARWGHPCRYILVNAASGAYKAFEKICPPVALRTDFVPLLPLKFPSAPPVRPGPGEGVTAAAPPDPHKFALLCMGNCVGDEFRNDLALVYSTLIGQYGFLEENIFVVYGRVPGIGLELNGDEYNDERYYQAYKDTLKHICDELAGATNTDPAIPALGEQDQLFVFMEGTAYWVDLYPNPVRAYLQMAAAHNAPVDDFRLYADEFAAYVRNIACAQQIFLFAFPSSGSFLFTLESDAPNAACKNRKMTASTLPKEYDTWNPLTGNQYGEYVWYWAAAVRGYYPPINDPWASGGEATGTYPFAQRHPEYYFDHPGDFNPDLDGDGQIQMEEAFRYADYMDINSVYGYSIHPSRIFPYGVSGWYSNPVQGGDIGIDADLLTLNGYTGTVKHGTSFAGGRNYVFGGNLAVDPSYPDFTLTIGDEAQFFLKKGDWLVPETVPLHIGGLVNFYLQDNNYIQIDGPFRVGRGWNVESENGMGMISLTNRNDSLTLDWATFSNTYFWADPGLQIRNSQFSGCEMLRLDGPGLLVENSLFNNTQIFAGNSSLHSSVQIRDCEFQSLGKEAPFTIQLYGTKDFDISNNSFSAESVTNAIQLMYAGQGAGASPRVDNNQISGAEGAGVLCYNSTASFTGNVIQNNRYGMQLMNYSNTAVYGTSTMRYAYSQQIRDNASYELYATSGSFPWYFRFNAIIDNDNGGNSAIPPDPLVYNDVKYPTSKVDVMYNCWGTNFDASEDLRGCIFKWSPTWCPSTQEEPALNDFAYVTYMDAMDQKNSGHYAGAKLLFREVIKLYPNSSYATSALQELYNLESATGDDYDGLRTYYLTNDSIVADTTLKAAGEFWANRCDVKLQNWPTAIDWYENQINNPQSPADSIFAIIDLGDVYLQMEQQAGQEAKSRAPYQGALLQHRPVNRQEYAVKRDYLLSLLPIERKAAPETAAVPNPGAAQLFQNVPNPFGQSTRITYELGRTAQVCIRIHNLTGKEVQQIARGQEEAGTHQVEFTNPSLAPGLYFYSLWVDGKPCGIKKMCILK